MCKHGEIPDPPKSKDLQFQSQVDVIEVTGWILGQDCETPQGGRNRNQSLSWGLGVVRKRCHRSASGGMCQV